MESNGTQTAMTTVGADKICAPTAARRVPSRKDALGGPSDAEKARAFRALIRGEYRAQYAEETQKLINRRFKETEKLRQRVKELEALGNGGDTAGNAVPVGNAVLSVPPGDGRHKNGTPGTAIPTETGGAQRAVEGVGPYGEMPGRARDDAERAAEGVGPYRGEALPEAAGRDALPEARRGGACPSREEAEAAEAAARGFAALQSEAWLTQAAALRARQPDFDLDAMRADPTFALLLMHGAPLEQAWRAATVTERERAAAAEAERALTADIRARGSRPPEAGAGAAPGFSLRPDVAAMSDGEVREVLARLAEKERISFG